MRRLFAPVALALLVAAPAWGEDKPGGKGKQGKPADETIDSIMEKAAEPPPSDAPPPEQKPPEQKASDKGKAGDKGKPGDKVATAKQPGKAEEPAAPPTDDNDNTAEAARPAALQAVKPAGKPRVPGPYELGDLDCRMLDGAGIERLLPKKITAGEEPDLLCRVVVTQPATVQTASHKVTLTVSLGDQATYQQMRTVRVSSVGRRALVFIIPADRISSEEAAKVTMRATLSAPAKPPTREVKFVVEPAD